MNTGEKIQQAEHLMNQGAIEAAQEIYEALCRMEHLTMTERGVALFGSGACFFLNNSFEPAAKRLKESWELLIASVGMEHALTARTMVFLSRALIALGQLDSGVEIGRGALAGMNKIYGPDADQTATAAFFLSSGAFRLGHLAEAEDLTQQAMSGWQKVYGPDSLQVASCLDALAALRSACGEKEEELQFLHQALDIKMRVLGEHEATAASLGHVGMAEAKMGHWQEAADLLSKSLDILKKNDSASAVAKADELRQALVACQANIANTGENGTVQ